MKNGDMKSFLLKEYKKSQKQITTAYFFLVISIFCYGIFFFYQQELMLIGTGFLFDAAAVAYLLKALKSIHPYWEMQFALKIQQQPTLENIQQFCIALELASEQHFPPFNQRSQEIFSETLEYCRKQPSLSSEELEQLSKVIESCTYK